MWPYRLMEQIILQESQLAMSSCSITWYVPFVALKYQWLYSVVQNTNGASDPNGAVGNQGAALLIADIDDTKSNLTMLNKTLPVGTADAGSYFNTLVLEDVSYGVSHFRTTNDVLELNFLADVKRTSLVRQSVRNECSGLDSGILPNHQCRTLSST